MEPKKKDESARFVRYFGPLLDALRALGGSGTPDEVVERIALDLGLSDEVQNELTPSGKARYRNQVAWARFYLVTEGLLDSSKHGVWSLTERGRSTTLSPEQAREIVRKWVHFFQEQRRRKSDSSEPSVEELQVNPLVSFKVLFQCKRYAGSVSPSQVRDFRGAMSGRADKGIIITTGTFTAEARREALRDGVAPIELVDGEKLVEMFKKYELGVTCGHPMKSSSPSSMNSGVNQHKSIR
jgi:restriction system protein